MTPLIMLFQQWDLPNAHIFFFLDFISSLIIWLKGGEVCLLGTKETARQQKENILGTVRALLFVSGMEVPTYAGMSQSANGVVCVVME